jgi:hypothetical protein
MRFAENAPVEDTLKINLGDVVDSTVEDTMGTLSEAMDPKSTNTSTKLPKYACTHDCKYIDIPGQQSAHYICNQECRIPENS